jgi:hypothetical protein
MHDIRRDSDHRETTARAAPLPALGHFLNDCLTTYAAENSGAASNYTNGPEY